MAYTYTHKTIYVFWIENGEIKTRDIVVELPNWKEPNYLSASSRHYTQDEQEEINEFFHKVFHFYPTANGENFLRYCSDFCGGEDTTKYAMWSYSNDVEVYKEKMREEVEKDILRMQKELEAKHKTLAIVQ